MRKLELCFIVILLLPGYVLAAIIQARQDVSAPYLNANITAKGKLWLGSAIDITFLPELSDTSYMTVWNKTGIFGSTTPINAMKWVQTERSQGVFSFTEGQRHIDLAKATNKKIRCHNLVWGYELPSWVTQGTWTNATLSNAMKNHIQTMITHYGTSCYSWDVVNEAVNSDGTFYTTNNTLYKYIGEAYVPLAFQYAYQAVQSIGGGVKLYYNEAQAEQTGAKQQALVSLIKRIQATPGAHIDGVGLESHYYNAYPPNLNSMTAAMASYTALGVSVAVTELDVACKAVPCSSADLKLQVRIYYNSVISCMKDANCIGVTVWDFDDKYSDVQPNGQTTAGSACLYFSNLTRHPAYTAVAQAIYEWDCSVCG